MNTYVAVHNHEYGASAYLFRASDILDDAELARTLNLDFEPERGEWIDVCPVNLDDIATIGPALDGDARPAHLDGGTAARSLAMLFRVDVPADCPVDDAGIVSAVNQCMEAGQADAIATIEDGEIDSPEADAVAGMTLGRINAILPDAGLIDTAARYRDAVRYSPDAGDVRDATKLADAFLSLGIV